MTTTVRTLVQDVFAAQVPTRLIDADVETVAIELNELVLVTTMAQYRDRPDLVSIDSLGIDWLITSDPDEVERFQPAHDCTECRSGNERAMALLREHPDAKIALANVSFVEVCTQ